MFLEGLEHKVDKEFLEEFEEVLEHKVLLEE